MEGDEYIQASNEKGAESFTSSAEPPQNPRKKKNKIENKRRFSDEQIRSLECIFESESKLEPRKKMQLARDLGLQPRQVAIWFQNRRARWKSKRIEQEYRKLTEEYDNLASRFESVKKEKESLQLELQKLSDLMETSHNGRRECKVAKENSTDEGCSGSGHSNWRTKTRPSLSNRRLEDREAIHYSGDLNDKSRMTENSDGRGDQLLRMDDEHVEVPLSSSLEKWYGGDPSSLLDQSCSSSQWLDFWT